MENHRLNNLFSYVHLQWFGGAKAGVYASGNIDNATRNLGNTVNTPVTGWDKANDFVVAIALEAQSGATWVNTNYRLEWRNKTDGGSFAVLGNTGELTYNGATNLVEGNSLDSGEAICTPVNGTTYVAGSPNGGVEKEGAATFTGGDASTTNQWSEFQFSVDASSALSSKEYEFQIYDVDNSVALGPSLATLTTAAGGTTYTVYAADSLNFSEGNAENADFVEAGSDIFNLSDGVLENADFAETAFDVLSFIDGSIGTKAGGVVYNVEGGEALNFSGGSLENIFRTVYAADVLNLEDGSLENSIFDRKSSDIINFTDGSLENVIFVRKASDFINFSEGNLENVVFARSASDVLNLSDGSLRKIDFNEKVSDQILFSDGSAASVPGGSVPSSRKLDLRIFGPGIRG